MRSRLVRRPPGAFDPSFVPAPSSGPVAAAAAAAQASGDPANVVTDTSETVVVAFRTWTDLSGAKIAQTTRPWRALDVFVSPSPTADTVSGTISVFVYALVKGARTLIGSGRVCVTKPSTSVGAKALRVPVWTCAIRTFAESFEVVALWQQPTALGLQGGSVSITVVGSNDDTTPPPYVGVVSMGLAHCSQSVGASQGVQGVGLFSLPQPQLVSVRAINGAAAARYLHAHDVDSGLALVAGIAPEYAWPMGAAIGSGIFESFMGFRVNKNLILMPSSTLLTTTAVADCAVSAMVR